MGPSRNARATFLASVPELDVLDTPIALPTAQPTIIAIASQAATQVVRTKPATTAIPASLAVFTSPTSLAIPVLSQNPTTPVSAHRLDRRPPLCVTPSPAFGQPGIAPTSPQKQIPEPPPTAPQTLLRCTHSGGAPAPAAHVSLLYGYFQATLLTHRFG